MGKEVAADDIRFIVEDIFTIWPEQFDSRFHLIILKDAIEHIADKEMLSDRLKDLANRAASKTEKRPLKNQGSF